MKKRISLIIISVVFFVLICTAIPFFVSAATANDADFKLTSYNGTVTYHSVSDFNTKEGNPTIAASAGGTAKIEMLRSVTYANPFRIYGDVDFDGKGYTYTYTGLDYAFWTYNNTATDGYGHNVAKSDMKKAKFTNLVLLGICASNSGSAGGFKFYNSILELGEGNNISTENVIILTPRDQGKVIISGGEYSSFDRGGELFSIGGDLTPNKEGPTYYSTVDLEITGGIFFSCEGYYAVSFYGSERNNCTLAISGGEFRSQWQDVVRATRGSLSITGGTFYSDIKITENVTANVTGGIFPEGIIIKGNDAGTSIASNVVIKNPVIAELYIENSNVPYLSLTRSDLVHYFSNELSTNVFRYDSAVYGKSTRIEILDNFNTYYALIRIGAYKGSTATVNGNGKTVYGCTLGEPILRVIGSSNIDRIIFDGFNINNSGASCLQLYGNVNVDVYDSYWLTEGHRCLFPTDGGTVNLYDGTILRGGQFAIYFDMPYTTRTITVNVYSGATLLGLDGPAIAFQHGSVNGTVNIYNGATVRTKSDDEYFVYIYSDVQKTENGNPVYEADGTTPVMAYADNNVVNVQGGTIIGGLIANNSTLGTNTVNINSGTLITKQFSSKAEAEAAVKGLKIGNDVVFEEPALSYIVTIPNLITFSPENSDTLKITADCWHFNESSQISVKVSSANNFQLRYQGGNNVDPYNYTLMSSQMGVVRQNCVAAIFKRADDGKVVDIEASIDIGQNSSIFAGEYSDALTFTINYTDTAESVVKLPTTDPGQINWNIGVVASEYHSYENQRWTIVPGLYVYRYSDLLMVPEAGTTISFIDRFGATTNGEGAAQEALTPVSVFIFSVWEYQDGEWIIDRTGDPNTTVGFNRRGYTDNVSLSNDAGQASRSVAQNVTVNGVELSYVTWSYKTQRNNEVIRLCYRCESDVTSKNSLEGPTITVIPPS